MILLPKKTSGETIVEILIATVLLVILLASAFVMLNRGARSNVNVKNRITALNLSREGIEAVRNIRDTNWLKYSGDRRNKWLCVETVDWNANPNVITDNCSGTGTPETITSAGFYQVEYSSDLQRYFVIKIDDAQTLDLSIPSDEYENFKLFKKNNGQFVYDANEGNNTETIFYRQVELVPETLDLCEPNHCDEVRLKIVSRVQWKEGEQIQSILLENYLFDFYERDGY